MKGLYVKLQLLFRCLTSDSGILGCTRFAVLLLLFQVQRFILQVHLYANLLQQLPRFNQVILFPFDVQTRLIFVSLLTINDLVHRSFIVVGTFEFLSLFL
jgi:hypothetical protein